MVHLRLSFFEVFNSNFNILNVLSQLNNNALPENIVLMYSKVFFNSKFKFSRKCQNKIVCEEDSLGVFLKWA